MAGAARSLTSTKSIFARRASHFDATSTVTGPCGDGYQSGQSKKNRKCNFSKCRTGSHGPKAEDKDVKSSVDRTAKASARRIRAIVSLMDPLWLAVCFAIE